MSARKLPNVQPQLEKTNAISAIEAYLCAGGVNPESVKRLEPCGIPGKFNTVYDFVFDGGRLAKASSYWVKEGEVTREYLWLEVALCGIGRSTMPEIFQHLARRNRTFHGNFKLALADDENIVVLVVRCAADGLSTDYLPEVLGNLDPASARLKEELTEFGITTVVHADGGKKQIH